MAERTGNSTQDIGALIQNIIEIVVFFVKFWYATVEGFIRGFMKKEEVDVNGKFVFITGTGHGIGKNLALQYSALGAKIICVDVNEANNTATVKEIKQSGGVAFGYTCDVTNREAIFALYEQIKKEHGFVEVIVNNAGIMPCRPLFELNEKEIRLMYEINVLAHFWILQAFLPDMVAQNKGHVVALSSCAGLFGLPNLVPYCGTKFAVRGLMQAMHEELRKSNKDTQIKFTTIYPYMVDTGLCKNPRFRFSWMKLVDPKEAAASIIEAQRTGLEEASVPRHFLYSEKVGRIWPTKAMRIANDFVEAYVDPDKQ
ncbi:17-beta-hydroxysteroid dehydrogenase 13 [Musca vetustissima]|uniref:17-beta-hydroxysteroid dehydrogenase 13 n=1 Tax=Musca vetustissima TaxID=27455 RepID=UPI002AB70A69|nr:17-beta-hydroxysteroid dehydrogenase 13 [Musca vetustissima]